MKCFGVFFITTLMSFNILAKDIEFDINVTNPITKSLIQEIKTDLSPFFLDNLPNKVTINFTNLNGDSLSSFQCGNNLIVGKMSRNIISIDNVLLKELTQGNRSLINCPHKTIKDYIKATIVHELAHLYDNHQKISKDPDFLNISGWVIKGLIFKRRFNLNQNTTKTPDQYEFENAREAFAVNIEHFLYDPTYKCRRPTFYEYYSKKLKQTPFKNESCKSSQKVVTYHLDGAKSLYDLDPERVYEVHYLLAGKGDQAMSRFGHSMYRIVVCAPETKKGPDCLKDTNYHLVLSFRANIADPQINTLKGLNGEYPSELFIFSLGKIVEEYTAGELREIRSLPLKLKSEELNRFINRTRELVWSYSGKYYFLTNNCATESLNLLRVAFENNKNIQSKKINTPIGLYNYLNEIGLGDESVFKNLKEASLKGYYFESLSSKVQASMNYLNITDLDLKKFMNKYDEKQRLDIYLNKISNFEDQSKAAANALRIENAILKHKTSHLQLTISRAMFNEKDENYDEFKILREKIKNENEQNAISFFNLSFGKTYGIPLQNELVENIPNTIETSKESELQINKIINDFFPEESDELKHIDENIFEIKKIIALNIQRKKSI